MVFKVGIVNDGEFAIRILQGGTNGAAFALVFFMMNEDPLHSSTALIAGTRLLKFLEDGGRLIRGTVIYDDDLHALEQRSLRQDLQSLQAGRNQVPLVIDGHEHRQTGRACLIAVAAFCVSHRPKFSSVPGRQISFPEIPVFDIAYSTAPSPNCSPVPRSCLSLVPFTCKFSARH